MKKIGILSDTHGTIAKQVWSFFAECDELWHAGDCGPGVLEELKEWKPVRAVYGNTDGWDVRDMTEEVADFDCEGLRVLMTHIGGYPGHYPPQIRRMLELAKPDIFVCGHSHILKVMYDKEFNFLHINPGAAGRQGFHQKSTLVRMVVDGTVKDLEIMEYDKLKIECVPAGS